MDILDIAKEAPIVIAPDGVSVIEERGSVFRMWAGQVGTTHVYIWTDSFESAFEELAEWCDDNAPGHITDVTLAELKEAAEDADIAWRPEWDKLDEETWDDPQFQRVRERAEEDLTLVGHTTLKHGQYMVSYEWGGEEVDPGGDEYETVLERTRLEYEKLDWDWPHDEDEEDEDDELEPNRKVPSPGRKKYTHFVVVSESGREWMIDSGWEYEEDAKDAKRETNRYRFAKVLTRRGVRQIGIDPDDGSNWTRGN